MTRNIRGDAGAALMRRGSLTTQGTPEPGGPGRPQIRPCEGTASYALDIRGHGASGRRGDIDYIGPLDDDLADFVAHVRRVHPHAIWTLAGFSAGGAWALRIAGGPYGNLFDRYIAIAPALIFPKGVARPGNGRWATVSVPRIGGLIVLNYIGIHGFDGLNHD